MSASGLGRVKTPTFNLRVEIPSRFRKFKNQKCLRPLLREDDRENNSAHSLVVHVFTQPGSKADIAKRKCHVCSAPHSGRWTRYSRLAGGALSGLFGFNSEILRMKEAHRSASSSRQRIGHPPPRKSDDA